MVKNWVSCCSWRPCRLRGERSRSWEETTVTGGQRRRNTWCSVPPTSLKTFSTNSWANSTHTQNCRYTIALTTSRNCQKTSQKIKVWREWVWKKVRKERNERVKWPEMTNYGLLFLVLRSFHITLLYFLKRWFFVDLEVDDTIYHQLPWRIVLKFCRFLIEWLLIVALW